eukprot:SAG31_NODE_1112_length_9855_cov_13.754203_7_plen_57_part_00
MHGPARCITLPPRLNLDSTVDPYTEAGYTVMGMHAHCVSVDGATMALPLQLLLLAA